MRRYSFQQSIAHQTGSGHEFPVASRIQRGEAMNGTNINPRLNNELPVWALAERYMFNFDKSMGLWSMMHLRRTELEYAKL